MPNVARIYDYYLGGRENFQADRDAAEELARLVPGLKEAARENRDFLHRVVRFMAGQGVSQFLDIGTGMPGMPGTASVLDVARSVNPQARVAYVDYDPMVVSHCNALLAKPDEAVVAQSDLRQPDALLAHPSVRGHLDFGQPVAIVLMSVLHFVSEDDDPAGIMGTLAEAVVPGSYLAIGHLVPDELHPAAVQTAVASLASANASAGVWPRNANSIRRLFDGFELVEPGLVPHRMWHPDASTPPVGENVLCLGGVARKI